MRGSFLKPKTWRGRVLLVAAGYGLVVIGVNAAIFAAVGLARLLGQDPRATDASLPSIKHLRQVDEQLWAGAQPDREDITGLADLGFKLIVDLRTGTPGDPGRDDPEQLRSLGMDYVSLPIVDGRTPNEALVDRFVELVENSGGPVFMHCGGGVGRSTSLEAAYRAETGREQSVLDQLAVGPPTVEQMWFAATVGPAEGVSRNPLVQAVSRAIDAPRHFFHWVEGTL